MREPGGYDPTIPPPGRPGPEHYCTECVHLRIQHTDGCPWCDCTLTYQEAS